MATNFPTNLDSLTNPTGSDTLASVPHADQHANANDAIEAIETKVGIDGSVNTGTLEVRAPRIATSTTRPPAVAGRMMYETDTKQHMVYVNASEQWQPVVRNTGYKNQIINGDFRVNQRAFSSRTTTGYGFDRWRMEAVGGTSTYSAQQFVVGNFLTGIESANYARIVTSGLSAAGDYSILHQHIEDVRTLSGEVVTISFWARAGSGTPKIAVEFLQLFGSGGSPSANVSTLAGQVTLTTLWARYSLTVALPTLSSKTIGTTANSSAVQVNLWLSAGSTFNTRTNSLGTQNNTFDIWGVQVEQGSVATDLERRTIAAEVALCQRYYERLNYRLFGMWNSATTCRFVVSSRQTMRTNITPVLLTTTPTAEQWSIVAITGTGSTISVTDAATPEGVDISINGFSGRTSGQMAMFYQNQLEFYADYP